MALCDYGPYAANPLPLRQTMADRIQQQKFEEDFEPLLNQTWRQKIPRSASFKVVFCSIVYNVFLRKNYDVPIILCGIPMDFPIFSSPKIQKKRCWPRPSATCGSPPHQSLPSRRGLCLKIAA